MGVFNWIILGKNSLLAPVSVKFFKRDALLFIKDMTETPSQHPSGSVFGILESGTPHENNWCYPIFYFCIDKDTGVWKISWTFR